MPDEYEKIARRYIEGDAGLLDFYKYDLNKYGMACPLCSPPEVEGARWVLKCLTNPANRQDLEEIIKQSNLRREEVG